MEPTLTVSDVDTEEAQSVIEAGLNDYNRKQIGYWDGKPLNVTLSDPATGKVLGGALGLTSLDVYFINLFFLPEALRSGGLGGRILKAGEMEAKRRGCQHVVLYTLTVQAPGFYARHGYREFGRIPSAQGVARIWMTKSLAGDA